MNIVEKLQGSLKSKTAWFAALLTVLGAVQSQVDLVGLIGEQNAGVVLSVIGGIVYWLRLVTNTPVEKK